MELRHMQTFVATAETGSMSAAAKQLRLAQPAVSQHIRALEHELGAALFLRSARGVSLTEAGAILLPTVRQILIQEANARSTVQSGTNVEVRIAATPTMAASLLPITLRLLQSSRPRSRLQLFERATTEALHLLAERSVDFAIVRDSLDDQGFEYEPLFEEPLVLAMSRVHPILVSDGSLLEARSEPFVTFERMEGSGLQRKALQACAAAGFVPRVTCVGAEVATMGQMIAEGVGLAIVPRCVLAIWDSPAIGSVPLTSAASWSTVYLATVPGRPLSDDASAAMRAVRRSAAQLR